MLLNSRKRATAVFSHHVRIPVLRRMRAFLTRVYSSCAFPATGNQPQKPNLRRGRSLLARDEDVHESGLTLFNRGTLRRKKTTSSSVEPKPKSRGCLSDIGPGPKDGWFIYCYLLTCLVPGFLLRSCGKSPRHFHFITFLNFEQVSARLSNKEHGERKWVSSRSSLALWLELVFSRSVSPKLSVANHQTGSIQVSFRTLRSLSTAMTTTFPISSTQQADPSTAMRTRSLKETGTPPAQIFRSCSKTSIRIAEASSPRLPIHPSPVTVATSIGISPVTFTTSLAPLPPTSQDTIRRQLVIPLRKPARSCRQCTRLVRSITHGMTSETPNVIWLFSSRKLISQQFD